MSIHAEALPDVLDATSAAGQRKARTRWWFLATVVVIAPLLLVVTAILAVVVIFMSQHRAALAKVNAEVARIQAAGEPITTADMYAANRVPPGTNDITPLWLAALDSFDEQKLNADGKLLPVVGEGSDREVTASNVAAVEQFLAQYDGTVQATLTAAKADGECRLFVEFDDGFSALLPHVQKMRALSRLMLLRGRVAMVQGDSERAVESVEAQFEVSRALDHQLILVGYLVRLATSGLALRETVRLLNELDLSAEQLARLKAHVETQDFQAGLVKSLQGERGLGYHMFSHPEQFDMAAGEFTNKAKPGEGQVTRAADCLVYLELHRDMQAAAREPFPAALDQAAQVEMQLQLLAGNKNPLHRYNHLFTLLIMPATGKAFEAAGRNLALRDLVRCAIAARQYQAANGELPKSLAKSLAAHEFLPAVPADPFDGQPLRVVAGDDGLTFYSIGRDRKDDGGADPEQSGQPDIAVKIKSKPASTP
jgi:hypothetical protein